jgi:shikimate kinase
MTVGLDVAHIVVVGLMGTGKSTVGAIIARRLGWPLRDSDIEIEAATGRTVRELRDEIGVDSMHELEARQLLDALAAPGPSVVAPAASIVDVETCRAALLERGTAVVFLTASPEVAAARFKRGAHRPWYGADPEAFLAEQSITRTPLFRSLDPIELGTDGRSPAEIAEAAISALTERGFSDPHLKDLRR